MRLSLVANPASGGGRAARVIPTVARALHEAGVEHELYVSGGPDEPERLARAAAEAGTEVVAAVGGDGLVGMVANGLLGTNAALAVIPLGSGNDFARMLGVRDITHAIRSLSRPRYQAIDVGRIESEDGRRAYVCVAGAGFDSEVNEVANTIRRLRGKPKYAAAVLRTLARFQPAGFRIDVDGERAFDGEAMMVAVGNARSYGGGMNICPDASLTDGSLDGCVVTALSRPAFVRAFPKVFKGTHVSHPAVRMLRGTTMAVEADRPFLVYADGDPVGRLPATFSVIPGALQVVIP